MSGKLECAELDALLCDYVDGSLDAVRKAAVQAHLGACPACTDLARDAAAAVQFLDGVADVEVPAALITRIIQETPLQSKASPGRKSWLSRMFGRLFEPILQPRLVMGMAMTILSFAMLGRFAGIEVRQLRASDLDPVKIWESMDDRLHRTWARGVKYYESLRLVYEIQSRLREWNEQDEEQLTSPSAAGSQPSSPGRSTGPVPGANPGESK
jgi:anti-sigma factor RsiW